MNRWPDGPILPSLSSSAKRRICPRSSATSDPSSLRSSGCSKPDRRFASICFEHLVVHRPPRDDPGVAESAVMGWTAVDGAHGNLAESFDVRGGLQEHLGL